MPTATVYIERAGRLERETLGGTSNALFAGLAAKLAEKFGRFHAGDNLVTLMYPVNERAENDLHANALNGIDFVVDPAPVTTDLREIRSDINQALISGLGKFQKRERVCLLTPKAVVRKLSLGH